VDGLHPAFTLVLALAVGVFAQSVARHLRVPGIVLLLLAGATLGPDGLAWVEPVALGEEGLRTLVELSVAIILFEGGLNLEISRLRREQAPIRRLVLYGSLVTLFGAAVAVRSFLPDWDWMTALVFGGLVIVTGPTVVGPLIEELRLRPRVATVLEAEGVLIDPIGAVVAVLLLEIALAPSAGSVTSGAAVLLSRVGLGVVGGVAAGFSIAGLLRSRLVPEGHGNILVLAAVLLLFQGCEEILAHSGLLAVTVAGVVVGNMRSSVDRDLREFKDQLTVLLIGMLFVLLAASVRLEDVRSLGTPGLMVVAALVLAVRPLAVAVSTAGSELSWRERLLVAWVAPRGIVAAAVASATAVALTRAEVRGEEQLLPLVFLTIACTVFLAGFTAGPVARALGQRLPGRDGVAILGAGGLGLLLARELRDAGNPVLFLDSNPQSCRRAEEEGFPVVYGNALQERTLLRARMGSIGSVVGLTPNQMLNSVFVSRTRDRFDVPRGYVAVERFEAGLAPELVQEGEAQVLFDGPHEVERWDVRERHGQVDVERWEFRGAPQAEESAAGAAGGSGPAHGDRFVILTLRRGKATLLVHGAQEPKPGDVAAVAVHREERDSAHEALRGLGFEPYVEEKEEEPGVGV
jgi:NhaP-type Na+/H+ or K+/H+ antiporter